MQNKSIAPIRHESGARFSKVVIYNGVLHFCGFVSKDRGDIKVETASLLKSCEEVLKKYGTDKEHMLTTEIYLKDIADLDGMNEAWDEWTAKDKGPSRVCIEAALAGTEYLIEIVMTAAIMEGEETMEIKRYDASARSSRVVEHNGVLYFGGHAARPEFVTITEQTTALLARFEELFEQFGTDKEHLLTATIYLKDMNLFDEMNAVWDKWITQGNAPTRACVQAKMSHDYVLLEVVVTAVKTK